MSHRDGFLAALAENEDDVETRLIYADWLEERGETAEAERQRKWPESKAWLVRFCETADCPDYKTVIAAAVAEKSQSAGPDYYDSGHRFDDYGDDDTYFHFSGRDAGGEIPPEFWDHVECVTGQNPPVRAKYFSCSC